ncbi:MAG: heme-binding domain-containing protein [Deinococcales bacterium]|nr:heme-binding domain-containing protein [Chitinophagaceae bacterium]
MFKAIGIILLIAFVAIQFFHPVKNIAATPSTQHISKLYAVPANVEQILVKACYDCHSNTTKYPWYSNIQPVDWWLNDHIKDGKRHLNFDEFTTYRVAKQYKKLEECIAEVKDGEMPLENYCYIHKNAVLTNSESETLFTWCDTIRDSIKAKYPADSLVLPKRIK